MRKPSAFVFFGAACLLAPAAPVRAQEAPPPPPRPVSVLAQLFPNPTGQNGFEDVALAIDALKDAKAAYPPEREFTLEKKRAYLADPACQKALFYLRAGMAKKVVRYPVPEPTIEAMSNPAMFTPFAGVRALARLLAVEQYVLLADGKTREAVVSMEYSLRMAHALKGATLISGLVATSVNQITLELVARHRDQWSVRDCERIHEIVRTYRALPDPALGTVEWERRLALQLVAQIRKDADAALAFAPGGEEDEEEEEDLSLKPYAAEIERLRTSPGARAAYASEISSRMNAAYDRLALLLRDPDALGAVGSTPPAAASPPTLAGLFVEGMTGSLENSVVALLADRVRLQLLGVHAAIRKYRWESGRLPERLDDLEGVGDLATDPFSGKPLLYKKIGENDYELSSIGGPGISETTTGRPDYGKRRAITLPRKATPP